MEAATLKECSLIMAEHGFYMYVKDMIAHINKHKSDIMPAYDHTKVMDNNIVKMPTIKKKRFYYFGSSSDSFEFVFNKRHRIYLLHFVNNSLCISAISNGHIRNTNRFANKDLTQLEKDIRHMHALFRLIFEVRYNISDKLNIDIDEVPNRWQSVLDYLPEIMKVLY